MKKLMLSILSVIAAAVSVYANNPVESSSVSLRPDMKYRELKKIYSVRDYRRFQFSASPEYNVSSLGSASYFIPGLGQFIAGEPGLGCAHIFPWACGVGLTAGGVVVIFKTAGHSLGELLTFIFSGGQAGDLDPDEAMKSFLLGSALLWSGAGIMLLMDLISSSNAKKVAKIKNMYYDDLGRQSSLELKFTPYVDVLAMKGLNDITPVAGISLKLSF